MPARSVIFRLLAAAPLCVLSACASNAASQAEMGALRAEVGTLRESQARLMERLSRLEAHAAVEKARATLTASRAAPVVDASASGAAGPGDGMGVTPELAVVKLKPRSEPAPKLPTAVPVVEPDSDQMEMFISAAPEGGSASQGAGAASEGASGDDAEAVDPQVLDAEYDKAVSLLRTGNVEGGVERLRRFAEDNARHPRADNALYFSGLGQMGLSEFKDAAKTFERLIHTYPAGDAMLDSMLRLAECRMRLNQAADAKALYTRVVTQFPGTAAATQAEQRLAALPK